MIPGQVEHLVTRMITHSGQYTTHVQTNITEKQNNYNLPDTDAIDSSIAVVRKTAEYSIVPFLNDLFSLVI